MKGFLLLLTLSKQNVTDSRINVVVNRVSAVNHQAIHKLHGLGSLTSQLTRDNNFTTPGSTLHDETQHTIAGPGERTNTINYKCKEIRIQAIQTLSSFITMKNNIARFLPLSDKCLLCLQAIRTLCLEDLQPDTQNVDLTQNPQTEGSFSDSSSYHHWRELKLHGSSQVHGTTLSMLGKELTYGQPDRRAACSAVTLPERWHTDHGWRPSQHRATKK